MDWTTEKPTREGHYWMWPYDSIRDEGETASDPLLAQVSYMAPSEHFEEGWWHVSFMAGREDDYSSLDRIPDFVHWFGPLAIEVPPTMWATPDELKALIALEDVWDEEQRIRSARASAEFRRKHDEQYPACGGPVKCGHCAHRYRTDREFKERVIRERVGAA